MQSAVKPRRDCRRFNFPVSSAAVTTPQGRRRPREAGGATSRLPHRRVTAMIDPGGRKRGRRKRRRRAGGGGTVCGTGGREGMREMESEGGVCASTREPEMTSTGFLTRYSLYCTSSARKRDCWRRKNNLILVVVSPVPINIRYVYCSVAVCLETFLGTARTRVGARQDRIWGSILRFKGAVSRCRLSSSRTI